MKPTIKYLSLYERSQVFGGPEEGGWYYDHYNYIGTSLKVKIKGPPFFWNILKRYAKKSKPILDQQEEFGPYRYHGGIEAMVESSPGVKQTRGRVYYE